MRVAVYHNLPPGGALRALWEFLRRAGDRHQFDLFTVDLGRADPFAYARGRAEQHDLSPFVGRTYRFPLFGPRSSQLPLGKLGPLEAARRMPPAEREIASVINGGGYDVAYVHPCQLEHTPSLLRFLRIPSLHYMQEPRRRSFEAGYRSAPRLDGPTSIPRWAATTVLERTLRRRDLLAAAAATRLACNSHYSAESILRSYAIEAELCPPGVDTETFSAEGRRHFPRAGDRSNAAISVGALDPVKGHDLVVSALALLPEPERPALHLVYERYDEAYRHKVETLARKEHVVLHLHRGISDAELAVLYRSSSVTVLAARLEPLGLVPLESLACGTPVVAVAEGGFRETVTDGVNGYLVRRSPSDLADAIRRVLRGELRVDPEALRSRVLSDWNWDSSVKRQLDALSATASQGRRGP